MMLSIEQKALLPSHKAMAKRLRKSAIDFDLTARWERGEERFDEAVQMAKDIADLDWLLSDNILELDFGGDGDNGEILIDLIDALLRLRLAERP